MENYKITLVDFETLVIQIEAILNSRHLFRLPQDINESEVLIPAHFLIGGYPKFPVFDSTFHGHI